MLASQATESLAAVNMAHWDRMAGKVFELEWVKILGGTISRTLRDYAGPLGLGKDIKRHSPVRVLDYACGDGLAAWALSPYTDVCVGMDISKNMVAQFNRRVQEAGIESSAMYAVQGDVLDPTYAPSDPGLDNFDAVVTSMALHHFPQPGATVAALVKRLRPGGTLAIIDWAPGKGDGPLGTLKDAGEKHEGHGTLNHAELSAENVLGMLKDAGCDVATAYYVVIGEKGYIPEEVIKQPGGVHGYMFLAFAKRE